MPPLPKKLSLLIQHSIEPIVCIGETVQERNEGSTVPVLEKQLFLIAQLLKEQSHASITIAYEPMWAIGAHQVPRAHEISDIFRAIRNFLTKNAIHNPALFSMVGVSMSALLRTLD